MRHMCAIYIPLPCRYIVFGTAWADAQTPVETHKYTRTHPRTYILLRSARNYNGDPEHTSSFRENPERTVTCTRREGESILADIFIIIKSVRFVFLLNIRRERIGVPHIVHCFGWRNERGNQNKNNILPSTNRK